MISMISVIIFFWSAKKTQQQQQQQQQNKTENKNQHVAKTNKGKLILLSKCVMIKND